MSARVGIACVVLAACAGSAANAPHAEPPAAPADEHEGIDARRCLPIVTLACNCALPCGLAVPREDGTLAVTREHWGTLPARVVRYCVPSDAHCTDALAVDLGCTTPCAPLPADPTCGFIDGVCQSAAPTGGFGGVYEVSVGSTPVGTLRLVPEHAPDYLGAGTYHYSGGAIDAAREFYFVTHPDGPYQLERSPAEAASVGTLRFDPWGAGFGRDDPRRSVLLLRETDGTVRFHSLVSELETYRIARPPAR